MKIAIAGFGQEGKASYEYWNKDGNELIVVDEIDSIGDLPEGAASITGANAFDELSDFDLIIRSPGINPRKLPYGDKVWSATNEFFAKCPAPIIGVTGTKGKGTTSSLIASILNAAGRNVHLVGNIGVPAVTELPKINPEDIVIFELSSFQLWDAKKSPHVAVILGIEPDHLDVHDSMEDYVNAKANIRRFQKLGDACVYHPTNELSANIAATTLDASDMNDDDNLEFAHRYAIEDDGQVYAQEGFFLEQGRRICETNNLRLPGVHNIENACAAMSAVMELWLDVSDEAFAEGLRNFEGLPHRLKFVREVGGVKYYDDSIATTPGSAIAALASFEEPKVIILGGHGKGADYTELIESCSRTSSTVIAVGANGDDIERLCEEADVPCVREIGDMRAIVKRAHETAGEGSVVVLSPAAASFDMFRSYSDRGDQFIAAVNLL